MLIKTGCNGIGLKVDKGDVVGLRCHNYGTGWERSEEPERIKLIVSKCCSCIIVPHSVTFNFIPDTHVGEKEFAVSKGTGSGITNTNFFTNKVFYRFDPGIFVHNKLSRSTVEIRNGHNIFVFFCVVFHSAVGTKIYVSGVDDGKIRFT